MSFSHSWNLTPEEAVALQNTLRKRLILAWDERPVNTVGGVDVSHTPRGARCAIVVLSFPGLEPIESAVAEVAHTFPYIPGLLAFREGPAILAAWQELRTHPDLLMFDGQGIAHPRGLGIASHMGLYLGIPTIGVAKSRLYGLHGEPGPHRGDSAPLYDERQPERVIGHVLRAREGCRPLFISPGHLIDVEHALQFTRACIRGYRLPEPTRWAHRIAGGGSLPTSLPLF